MRWLEACEMGRATRLSGGEPLVRQDLPILVGHARKLGYYVNLITSGYKLDEDKIAELKDAGLDHIQVSIQAPERTLNNYLAGTDSFENKKEVARLVKTRLPMVLCVVIHRQNIHLMRELLTWPSNWKPIIWNWPILSITVGPISTAINYCRRASSSGSRSHRPELQGKA